ncbi:hypothetical protein N9Y42_08010, partial [Mariniblastus sp.]|nr:hypothetical protein [Mariniblastus sp.]
MKNYDQKPACFYLSATQFVSGAMVFTLLIFILCDNVMACQQSASENSVQAAESVADAPKKIWNSSSKAALKTEAILRKPPTTELVDAETFVDAANVLKEMGLDIYSTASAKDDCLTDEGDWEMIGNSNEIGIALQRYCKSRNSAFSVMQDGSIEFISRAEMRDEQYFQTRIYRVDHLVSNENELKALAKHITTATFTKQWDPASGSAVMQPRLQSGHRLLVVSIHYESQLKIRQLLQDLSMACAEDAAGNKSTVSEDEPAEPAQSSSPKKSSELEP